MLRDAILDALQPKEWQCMSDLADKCDSSKYAVKKVLGRLLETQLVEKTVIGDQPHYKLKD